MARAKKFVNYDFDDISITIPSTYIATCTITGKKVPFYHKQLVKYIQKNYDNKFNVFVTNFVCSEAKKEEKVVSSQDPNKLNIYADYLYICYIEAKRDNDKYVIELMKERYLKNFNRDIELHNKNRSKQVNQIESDIE